MLKSLSTAVAAGLISSIAFAQTTPTPPATPATPSAPATAPAAPAAPATTTGPASTAPAAKPGHMAVVARPANAPADATALCNDGKFYKGHAEKTACAKHQGVKEWYGVAKHTPKQTAPAAK